MMLIGKCNENDFAKEHATCVDNCVIINVMCYFHRNKAEEDERMRGI